MQPISLLQQLLNCKLLQQLCLLAAVRGPAEEIEDKLISESYKPIINIMLSKKTVLNAQISTPTEISSYGVC